MIPFDRQKANQVKVNLKDSSITTEQKAKVYDIIEEHCHAFSLQDNKETFQQAEVHLKCIMKYHSLLKHMR